MEKNLIILIGVISVFVIYYAVNYHEDNFQSYAYPWREDVRVPWNWWRRWWRYPRRQRWRPRCPAGCRWINGKQGYGCPNPSLAYGNFACKYDFECKNCGLL